MVASAAPPIGPPQAKQVRNPISRRQIEVVISRSIAGFGIVFGAQTLPWLFPQLDEAYPLWLWIVVPALFGSLIVNIVLSFAKVWVRQGHALVAIIYALALVSWPFAILPGADIFMGIHWLYYLLTVATAAAAIAFNTSVALTYLVATATVGMVIRLTPAGGGAPWELAVLENLYAVILGGAVLIIVTMLRQAASSVDAAQATALDRYSFAVRQHATEVERVQVDSIVHDSVLTTLLSAARAFSPEAQVLAARMAGSAVGHLRDAALVSPEDGAQVRLSALAERVGQQAAEQGSSIEVRVKRVGTQSIPAQAAEAVYSAAVQAILNSLQHAGGDEVSRSVVIRGLTPYGIEVVVSDSGAGFVPESVPGTRLGVRVSIVERLANAGGRATITSAPGAGAVVSVRWPAAAEPEPTDAGAQPVLVRGGGDR